MRWFDRQFAFTFPLEIAPSVVERLRGLEPRVRAKIASADVDALRRAGPDGSWSAQTQIGHLLDLEPLWQVRLREFAHGADVLSPADLENRKTHETDHDAAAVATLVDELAHARAATLAAVEALDPSAFGQTCNHPRLEQPMRLVDHLFFVAEHDDHHLAKITELLARS